MELYSNYAGSFPKTMSQTSHIRRAGGGSLLGFPLEGFSLFQSLLLSLAAAFFTFFLTTFLAIFSLLIWNGILHHSVNYADSYLYVGLPAGILVLLVALPVFGTLWVRARIRT
jgi:hypothetical protein